MKARIYLVGRCDNPDCPKPLQSKQIDVIVNEADLEPSPCRCGGSVSWEHFEVHHTRTGKKPVVQGDNLKKPGHMWAWIIVSSLTALILALIGYAYYELHRGYSSEEIESAKLIVDQKAPAEILRDLPGSVSYKASLLQASRGTIRRLQNGDTTPQPIVEFAIRGLGIDYELLKRRGILFRIRYRHQYDLYSAIPNPTLENWEKN